MQRDRNFLNLVAFSAAMLGALSAFVAGCVSTPGTTAQPKPGTGIAEYRKLTRDAHQAITATLKPLQALARPADRTPHPDLATFDRALEKLEITSFRTRSRAEAIIARGQAYFDEWKAQFVGARVETERYARLLEHFRRIQERSGEVRTEFRPFMAKLREFRAGFDRSSIPTNQEQSRTAIDALVASGQRVLESLNVVSKSLDDAEMELRATLAQK